MSVAASTLSAADPSGPTSGVAGFALDVMNALGGAGAGALIAAENLFPPLPSEAILPLAGFAAGRGQFTVVEAIAWTTAGSVFGALVLYVLSAWLGRERIRRLAARMPLMGAEDVDRASAWFARHGGKAVFLGRMVPVVRSLVSVPAGVERMPVPKFVLLTTAGSLIWNTAFVLAGYALGAQWHRVEPYAGVVSNVVVVAAMVAVVVFVVRRLRARRAVVR